MDKELRHKYFPTFWITENGFINENQKPIEFHNHRFMIQPYNDFTPDQVTMKSAQVGWSVKAILGASHAAGKLGLNVIYVLPTRNASAEFVVPKVDPMIDRNPELAKMVKGTNNKNLKAVGDRWIYFKGAFHQGEAISTSADLIVADEYDRSDQAVLSTYQSRLQASDYRWYWKFSNPSLPSFGVHELWQDSDQMHWFVTCEKCGHEHWMDFERDDGAKSHYVDISRAIYACGKCHEEISDKARRNGRWWALYPHRERRGYWISQMMVPWVEASLILKQQRDMSTEDFHNFVLGKPFQSSEFMLNATAIRRATFPRNVNVEEEDICIGVDSGKTKHYVIGTRDGVFNYGKTDSWEDIERLRNLFDATMVIDALPDFTIPEYLAKKYRGKVYVNYYSENTKNMDTFIKGENDNRGRLDTDRTKGFDMLAGDISTQTVRFLMPFRDLQGENNMGLIYHLGNIYRIIETDPKGIQKARWETKENKPDHWAHALLYWRLATALILSSKEVGGVRSAPVKKQKSTFAVHDDKVKVSEALHAPMDSLIERSLQKQRRRKL